MNDFEILLAEDEAAVRDALTVLLESEGYRVRTAADGQAALDLFRERCPDLLLLDVMMPNLNGYAACRQIRAVNRNVPILFLTALDGEAEELRGLSLGADDFISKTASQAVLLARIAGALSRARRQADAAGGDFDFADWHVDAAGLRLVSARRAAVDLTVREVEILRLFAARPGEVFSRDFLFTRFWGVNFVGNETALSMAIRRLREKLGPAGACIRAVYGSGYRYACDFDRTESET